jgi:hypothetical protein
VHLPDETEWLAEYVHEMTSFPKGKFDDQCDSTSQALDWIKSGSKYDGFFKWLESESTKAKSKTFGADHSVSLSRVPGQINLLRRSAKALPQLRQAVGVTANLFPANKGRYPFCSPVCL